MGSKGTNPRHRPRHDAALRSNYESVRSFRLRPARTATEPSVTAPIARRTALAPSLSSQYAHHASAAREPTSAADRTGPSLTAATTRRPWAIRTGALGGWKMG